MSEVESGATFERISDEERVLWSESIPGHLWNAVRRMCECGAEVGVACDLETVEQHLMEAANPHPPEPTTAPPEPKPLLPEVRDPAAVAAREHVSTSEVV